MANGKLEGLAKNKGFILKFKREQEVFGVSNIDVTVKLGSSDPFYNVTNLKMSFALITLVVLYLFFQRIRHF